MSSPGTSAPAGPPQQIVLIRHGEKPIGGKSGVDVHGEQNPDCLIPAGWQRAGALAVLFDPASGDLRSPLLRPDKLYTPSYGPPDHKTRNHRTYETILPLRHRLELDISSEFPIDRGAELAAQILANDAGTSLVCWEHENIPSIAAAVPLAAGSPPTPSGWPKDPSGAARYDLVWLLTRSPDPGPAAYTFLQLPQLLLAGDAP